jgi:hypothetical protein
LNLKRSSRSARNAAGSCAAAIVSPEAAVAVTLTCIVFTQSGVPTICDVSGITPSVMNAKRTRVRTVLPEQRNLLALSEHRVATCATASGGAPRPGSTGLIETTSNAGGSA